jgi:hypothetical protein
MGVLENCVRYEKYNGFPYAELAWCSSTGSPRLRCEIAGSLVVLSESVRTIVEAHTKTGKDLKFR